MNMNYDDKWTNSLRRIRVWMEEEKVKIAKREVLAQHVQTLCARRRDT